MPPPDRTRSPTSLQAMEVAEESSRLQSRMDERRIRQPPMRSRSVTPGHTVIPEVHALPDPGPFQDGNDVQNHDDIPDDLNHEDIQWQSDLEMADGTESQPDAQNLSDLQHSDSVSCVSNMMDNEAESMCINDANDSTSNLIEIDALQDASDGNALMMSIVALNNTLQQMQTNYATVNETLQNVVNANKVLLEKVNQAYDGDDEDGSRKVGSHPRKRNPKIKLHDVKQPRPEAINQLHVRTRVLMAGLLRCHKNQQLPPPPSEVELDDFYKGAQGVGPTADNFKIEYLDRKINQSAWNQALWSIFMARFNLTWGHEYSTPEDRDRVSSWFWNHIKYLSSKYFTQTFSTPLEIERAKSQAARDTRRRTLFNDRLVACDMENDLKRFIPLMRQLGPNGMSSDESCLENGVSIYRICKRQWRATAVTTWIRQIDAVFRSLRVTSSGNPCPGRWPHPRVDGNKTSTRPPIRYLPTVCYRTEWLFKLAPWQFKKLDPKDEELDLTHTKNIIETAAFWSKITVRRAIGDIPPKI